MCKYFISLLTVIFYAFFTLIFFYYAEYFKTRNTKSTFSIIFFNFTRNLTSLSEILLLLITFILLITVRIDYYPIFFEIFPSQNLMQLLSWILIHFLARSVLEKKNIRPPICFDCKSKDYFKTKEHPAFRNYTLHFDSAQQSLKIDRVERRLMTNNNKNCKC